MNTDHIQSKFAAIGARLQTHLFPVTRWSPRDFAVDIRRDRHGEFFELRVPETLRDQLEVSVLQALPRERHLLLLVRREGGERQLDRFLCGHDERSWFVAAVPGRVSNVADAMESLKPEEVRAVQTQNQLTASQRNRRNNRAFRRQGEWFFVPAPNLVVDAKLVLRNEPIRRGGGKAHIVEELYREGGTRVYVNNRYPNGLEAESYRRLIAAKPEAVKWGWRVMVRDAGVYARGEIRHSDHRVITLPFWHRVLMNTETRSRTMRQVAFLD